MSGSFFLSLLFSRTQDVIKKSSNDNFFCSKKKFKSKSSSFKWILYHFEQNKLSFDEFLMTTWEQENESERKKEPQILRHNIFLREREKIFYTYSGPKTLRTSLCWLPLWRYLTALLMYNDFTLNNICLVINSCT